MSTQLVTAIFFDLDNTLYPPQQGVWSEILRRIDRYMMERTGIRKSNLSALRIRYFTEYGTTCNGLRREYGVDPQDFYQFVHDIPLESYLASDPDLLLLDEPASFLDPSVQEELHHLLHRLNERLTLIVVSHDVGFVSKHVQRVVCVNRKVVLHPTAEVSGDLISMLYGDMEKRIVRHDHHEHEG